jgi:anti-sigma B factor antagonist
MMPAEADGESPQQLYADLSLERGVLTARLVGPSIGQREGPVIGGMIETKLSDGGEPVAYVVLDFSDVSYINSAGLGACVSIHNNAKANNATVVVYCLQPDLRDVFKMTRLDKIFKMADDPKRLAKVIGKR